jgi:DMSO/TMAO reductase YedYZ molybdopterin-dependent catalytic subunit
VPPFHRSLELEKVLEDGVIAYEMNGEPLPDLHGAPARLIVPGWAGDHWMKWLVRLGPQPEAQKGFYMDVAYRFPKKPGEPGVAFKPDEMTPVTELPVKSSITTYPERTKAGAPAVVAGFAFSGAGEIAKVEVSDDDGAMWKAAVLGKDHDRFSWRLWSHTFTPRTRGKVRLLARATDARGGVQPREAVWNQSGYFHSGWQAVDIEVEA